MDYKFRRGVGTPHKKRKTRDCLRNTLGKGEMVKGENPGVNTTGSQVTWIRAEALSTFVSSGDTA